MVISILGFCVLIPFVSEPRARSWEISFVLLWNRNTLENTSFNFNHTSLYLVHVRLNTQQISNCMKFVRQVRAMHEWIAGELKLLKILRNFLSRESRCLADSIPRDTVRYIVPTDSIV